MRIFEVVVSTSNQLDEALKPSQYRGLVKNWDKSRYAEIFNKFPDKDKNAYRIYLPLPKVQPKSKVAREVEKHIAEKGYTIKDYTTGLATDGRREIRIGKLLSDTPTVAKKFASDPARAASKQSQLVVISRHPYDIAGMSTDRGWTSCMNLKDGMYSEYIPIDIKEGTIVAYLINENDRNIKNPIARIAIKPFVNIMNPKEVLFGAENKVYGTSSPAFKLAVKNWVDEVNKNQALEGVFVFNPELYQDSDEEPDTKIQINDKKERALVKSISRNPWLIGEISNPSEHLQLFAVSIRGNVISYIQNPSEKVQLAAVKRFGPALGSIKNPSREVQLAAVKQSANALNYIKNPSEEVQLVAAAAHGGYAISLIKNPTEKAQLVAVKKRPYSIYYIKNPSEAVQLAAVTNDGTVIEYIKNPSEAVQMAAVKRRPTAIEHIRNPSEKVKLEAVKRDGYALGYIKKPSELVQLAAVKEKPDAIAMIKNPSETVQLAAVTNDGTVIEYIKKPTEKVKLVALRQNSDASRFIKKTNK